MPKLKESSTSAHGPIDLCCPITLEFFKDPVKTIHGQTYERSAIEDWLLTKNTSTQCMTGETLKIKAFFPDDDMKLRCEQYLKSLQPTGLGRGGRGGRNGEEGEGGAWLAPKPRKVVIRTRLT